MKTKIVLWGENEKDEKILLGIELVEVENIIRIHSVPEAEATEIFYNQMMNQWREGQDVPMPSTTTVLDRPLSMTEGLLPDEIKTQRQDILARAKTEWHFVILSSKLYESYVDEVGQMKERISELKDFDGAIWEEAKAFWKKVQNQVQEKNLFREHAVELRTKTNELFDNLKSLKASMNDEFEKASKEQVDIFTKKLQDIEERIEKGLGLQPIFNELKAIQNSFKDVKFTRKHHNDVWKRLDGAFKKVKEKRFGSRASGDNSATNRLTRRLEGLLSAITKMEQSINRDVRDKQFQEKRINTTDGQLELQIRQAKMAMIIERINSKQVKLDDMLKTKGELEKKLEAEKVKAAKREEKKVQAKEVKKAKVAAKTEIANEINAKSEQLKGTQEKLAKAAEAIKTSKTKIPPVAVESEKAEVHIADSNESNESVVAEVVENVTEKEQPITTEKIEEVVSAAAVSEENVPTETVTEPESKESQVSTSEKDATIESVVVASAGNASVVQGVTEISEEIKEIVEGTSEEE